MILSHSNITLMIKSFIPSAYYYNKNVTYEMHVSSLDGLSIHYDIISHLIFRIKNT